MPTRCRSCAWPRTGRPANSIHWSEVESGAAPPHRRPRRMEIATVQTVQPGNHGGAVWLRQTKQRSLRSTASRMRAPKLERLERSLRFAQAPWHASARRCSSALAAAHDPGRLRSHLASPSSSARPRRHYMTEYDSFACGRQQRVRPLTAARVQMSALCGDWT